MPELDQRLAGTLPGPLTGMADLIHWDDRLRGFGLRVWASGKRIWIVRYRIGKRQRVVTLGAVGEISAAAARRRAGEVLASKRLGHDERQSIETRKANARKPPERTLNDLISAYKEHVVVKQKPRTQTETRRHLELHWQPLHRTPASQINRAAVAARLLELAKSSGPVAAEPCAGGALGPVRLEHARRAGRAQSGGRHGSARREAARPGPGDARAAADLACDRGGGRPRHDRAATNADRPAPRRGGLDAVVGARPRRCAMGTARGRGRRTVVRTRCRWRRRWSISCASCRAGAGGISVFGGGAGGFSGWSQSKARLDRRMAELAGREIAPWVLHDLRRTTVTGMAELGIQPHVIEAVVNHVSGHKSGIAGVYNQAIYALEKRAALQTWADHVTNLVSDEPARIVPLRRENRPAN